MAGSPQFDSSISVPPRQRKSFPRLAKTASSLWYLARLAAIAGLLASGSGIAGVGVTTGIAIAAQSASLAGQLLVARPELRDPRFSRTVVYIVHHDAGGAMGLILNRPIGEASLSELLEQAGVEGKSVNGKIRVHFGGPVEAPRGFVLHTADYKIDGTQVVKDGIAVTARPDILRAIGAGTGPLKSLFALGYAGWASGQIEGEIKTGSWEIVPADKALVFDEDYETKWERAMARRTIRL
jgi:putative transcriptional regulator